MTKVNTTSRGETTPRKITPWKHLGYSQTTRDLIREVPYSGFFSLAIVLMMLSVLSTQSAWAEFEILDVALAESVQNREPVNAFSPPAYCEKDKNGQPAIPTVNSAQVQQIYFWTRIASTEPDMVRYTWHHQTETGWENMAEVDLRITPSAGYRLWSSKNILPSHHRGQWMIVVSPSSDPNQVLCIARFKIE